MWIYEKRLQFPVNITQPNAKLAQVILSQYGGPDGELGASMRYISQRYTMPYPEVAALLTDIGRSVSELRILTGSRFLRKISPKKMAGQITAIFLSVYGCRLIYGQINRRNDYRIAL